MKRNPCLRVRAERCRQAGQLQWPENLISLLLNGRVKGDPNKTTKKIVYVKLEENAKKSIWKNGQVPEFIMFILVMIHVIV